MQVIKADNSKWDNDWDKIEKQRAEIRAIKEKKRISKLQHENDLKERNKRKKETEKKFKNAHEDSGLRRTSSNRHFEDKKEQELLRKRAEIKAIKEKKRLAKLQSENDLKERNKKKKETDKKFKNAHGSSVCVCLPRIVICGVVCDFRERSQKDQGEREGGE